MFGRYNQNGTSSYVEDPMKRQILPDILAEILAFTLQTSVSV